MQKATAPSLGHTQGAFKNKSPALNNQNDGSKPPESAASSDEEPIENFANSYRRSLDPKQDGSLLSRYADLVRLDACTTPAALEDKRQEAQQFREASIS